MDSSNTWNGSGFDETNFGMAVFICGSNTNNSLKNITCIGLQGLSKIMPLVQSCCETLSHYQHLVKIDNTIMDGNILTNNDFEVMLSKGLGRFFLHDEKMQLFQNAKGIADLLLTIVNQDDDENIINITPN
jgi:hypothetical protein